MEQALHLTQRLDLTYLDAHCTKEDLFWETRMGLVDNQDAMARAEQEFQAFICDPAKLAEVRAQLALLEGCAPSPDLDAVRHALTGWRRVFECNIIDNEAAAKHQESLIEMEAALYDRRRRFTMQHVNEQGEVEEASLGTLATNIATNPNESARKSSHDEFLRLERWVLDNGFLDIVRRRNALARSLGCRDYFDFKVRRTENMSPEELFAILDDFEERTRDANRRSLDALAVDKGEGALLAHNLSYCTYGDVRRQLDPYLPFERALQDWVVSFRRLGITFRGAQLQIDLLERKGKYENGFCHGPGPAWVGHDGAWKPGRINFTSLARPNQIGSGATGLRTLFHEGGHAAHFANVTQNSPCFSQEYAPTSMAYAETQSMFCDSIIEDADWLKRYAVNQAGEPVPDSLIRAKIETAQPWLAHAERRLLVVPCFEAALYRMPDADLTPDAVLALARATEQRILGLAVSPRPLLAIPHLLDKESAASYQGYLLAHMAVSQTRAYLLRRLGYLADNPAVGPLLALHYWGPGNSIDHNATLVNLTSEGFTARYLAEDCNRTVAEAWHEAELSMANSQNREYSSSTPESLDADIRIVHGPEVIADNRQSDAAMCAAFAAWVRDHYPPVE
ncbi:MAG: M3 family metallopeptidase [Capsulimonadaceae bacterium]